jgi:hypothetical protein
MDRFSVGEEVLYDGQRYVVSLIEPGADGRFRLLATGPHGTRVVWTGAAALEKIAAYTRPRYDTEAVGRPT